jgi:hypothetical protein
MSLIAAHDRPTGPCVLPPTIHPAIQVALRDGALCGHRLARRLQSRAWQVDEPALMDVVADDHRYAVVDSSWVDHDTSCDRVPQRCEASGIFRPELAAPWRGVFDRLEHWVETGTLSAGPAGGRLTDFLHGIGLSDDAGREIHCLRPGLHAALG